MTDAARRPELPDATVVIVGVGLLGGSLGRALSGRCAQRIGVVEDDDRDTARTAVALDAVDTVEPLAEAMAAADIVVLATPVGTTLQLLREVDRLVGPGTLVTDLGGAKGVIVEAMAQLRDDVEHVGGHPMCGGTTAGVGASDPAMFIGARWAVCPVARGAEGDGMGAAARLSQVVEAVGADPVVVDAGEHDRAVALVSHLPRVVAAQLVDCRESIQDAGDRELATILASRGWRGATRLAAGDEAMWDDVLAANADALAPQLRALAARLVATADRLTPS
ncbi:MAG: prephenate dehydrogenase [Thermoleophilia bacterium]|nr:prephenate dehydrogenase [Thermoleophilia bacterium]